MTFHIQGLVGAQPITDVSTVQKHALGRIVKAVDDGAGTVDYGSAEFIYLKGVASTVVGTWVTYNSDDWTTTRLAADAIGPVAIAMSANAAATTFGWYQIHGKAVGRCLTLFADNGIVYCTSTAGSVDDASVIGDVVHNAKGASLTVVSSGVAEFEIARPFVENRVSLSN